MTIKYDTEDLDLIPVEGMNRLRLALKYKIPIAYSCDGCASCGTCRVIITEGVESLPERTVLEAEMAEDRGFLPEERLACQLIPQTSFRFKLPED